MRAKELMACSFIVFFLFFCSRLPNDTIVSEYTEKVNRDVHFSGSKIALVKFFSMFDKPDRFPVVVPE